MAMATQLDPSLGIVITIAIGISWTINGNKTEINSSVLIVSQM